MSSFVCCLNNVAVSLLKAGNYASALQQFRDGLQDLQESIVDSAEADTMNDGIFAPSILMVSSEAIHKPYNVDDISPHNMFCFYDRAFELLSSPLVACDQRYSRLAGSVMLFNMGIALHQLGLFPGSSAEFLNQALDVYERAETLIHGATSIHDDNETNELSGPSPFKLLLLAVYSNLGHICSHLGLLHAGWYQQELNQLWTANPELCEVLSFDEFSVFSFNATTSGASLWAAAA